MLFFLVILYILCYNMHEYFWMGFMELNIEGKIDLIGNYLLSLPEIDSIIVALDNLKKLEMFLQKHHYKINEELIINLLVQSEEFSVLVNYLIKKKYMINDYVNNNTFLGLIYSVWYDELDKDLCNNFDEKEIGSVYQDYLYKVIRLPLLSVLEDKKLFKEYRNGSQEAYNKIAEGHMRMVISLANDYRNFGIPVEDLIQEGSIGLVKAIKNYQDNEKCKFSTYAYVCIRRAIIKTIKNKSKMIRIPEYLYDKLLVFKKAKNQLESKLGRYATIEEVATYMHIPVEIARTLYFVQFEPCSINEQIGDEDDEKEKFIADYSEDSEDIVIKKILKDNFQKTFIDSNLTEKEADIIKSRFGLNDGKICTLDEIGKRYGITRERVRQLEMQILKKLRLAINIDEYRNYMSDTSMYSRMR